MVTLLVSQELISWLKDEPSNIKLISVIKEVTTLVTSSPLLIFEFRVDKLTTVYVTPSNTPVSPFTAPAFALIVTPLDAK